MADARSPMADARSPKPDARRPPPEARRPKPAALFATMPGIVTVLLFILAVTAAGMGGYALLALVGLEDDEAWVGGRVVGMVLVALPAWWLGVAGLTRWRVAGATVLALGAIAGGWSLWRRREHWRRVLLAEAIVVGCALAVLLLRLDRPEILGTEKPMDLGILASLLRAQSFPPPDMWLAGETLPYYYWGALVWTVPIWLAHLPLEVAYNLVVALIGGMVAGIAFVVGKRLAGSWSGGALAAFLAVFAGTPDGLRQLLAGVELRALDYWHSSRVVSDTITEFPLFTVWLGDLHPHLLSMPLAGAALLIALHAGRVGPRLVSVALLAVMFGVTWAGNPWAMPPTLTGVALLLLSGDGRWRWPVGSGLRRWAAVVVVAVGGWLVTAPFHLGFHPPFEGVGLVHSWTGPLQLVLYAGVLLLPVGAAVLVLLRRRLGPDREWSLALTTCVLAGAMVVAAVTRRPTLVLLGLALAVAAFAVLARDTGRDRPAWALAALGLFLLLVPELVYVRDPYGEQLHRMNTVFKAYIQAWVVLALAAPALLFGATRRAAVRLAVVGVALVAAVPHLAGMVAGSLSGDPGLDGLRWMQPGDRAAVRFLRRQPAGSTLVEATGDPYSEYARLSAASGVPCFLGWANHEAVWRGAAINVETERRRLLIDQLYSSADVDAARTTISEIGADLVAVGPMERRDHDAESLANVIAAGEVVLEAGDTVLVRFAGPGEGGGEG
jgi:YYY domain-containing protein